MSASDIFSQQKDSVRFYNLEEITVKSGIVSEAKSISKINITLLDKADAVALSEIGKFIPSLKVQTNSRGETLFFLRGSGERQIALLFDGAPLNIPWDNRIDLSLIPTDAVNEINVTRGIPSVVYGANSLGGVVNVFSKTFEENPKINLSSQFGSGGFQKYSAYWLNGGVNYSYLLSVGYKNQDGYVLPHSFNDGISKDKLRANSHSTMFNTFAKFNYNFSSGADLSASLSYISSEKGVPPEMDVASPRYWQYPDWKKLALNINGKYRFGENNNSLLTYIFSATKFNMQINQYKNSDFVDLDDIEKDDDLTLFGRFIYTHFYGLNHIIKFTASGLTSTHKEKFLATNFNTTPKYIQNIFAAGAEYEFVNEDMTFILGAGLESSATPATGDKPSAESVFDYSINSSFIYQAAKELSITFNYGRKTRFPTLREAFSGALGKFEPNPDLKAESANTIESGVLFNSENISARANVFLSFLNDGIVRTTVTTDAGLKKYKRINKDAIRNYGFELFSEITVLRNITSQINFSYLNSYAKNSSGQYRDTLEYKPVFIAGFVLDTKIINNTKLTIETNYYGEEFGLQGGSSYFRKLPDYLLFNLRTAYNFKVNQNLFAEVFFRINNLFDKLYYTQWGLPEAGRQFFGGINFNF